MSLYTLSRNRKTTDWRWTAARVVLEFLQVCGYRHEPFMGMPALLDCILLAPVVPQQSTRNEGLRPGGGRSLAGQQCLGWLWHWRPGLGL